MLISTVSRHFFVSFKKYYDFLDIDLINSSKILKGLFFKYNSLTVALQVFPENLDFIVYNLLALLELTNIGAGWSKGCTPTVTI